MPVRRFLLTLLTALLLAFPWPTLAALGDGLFPDAADHWPPSPSTSWAPWTSSTATRTAPAGRTGP